MSDFIDNLLTRTIESSTTLLPRPLSQFEPVIPSASPPAAENSDEGTMQPERSYTTAHPKTEVRTFESPVTGLTEKPLPITAPALPQEAISHPTPAVELTKSPSASDAATPLSAAPKPERVDQQETTGPARLTPIHNDPTSAAETLSVESPSRPAVSDSDHSTAPSPPPSPILSPPPVEVVEAEPAKAKESPERSDEIVHAVPRQPQHPILRAMVRQMVLQPISREEPVRPLVEPAETRSHMEAPAPGGQTLAGERLQSMATESLPRSSNRHAAPRPTPTNPLRAKRAQNPESGELAPTRDSQEPPLKAAAVAPTLKPLAQRLPPFPETPQTTEVHITIGRVEVRATSEKPAAPPPPKRQFEPEVMSLDAYLAQRTGKKG